MAEYIVRETGYPGTLNQEVIVEIVRCEDCAWFSESGWCRNFDICMSADDFCSCAKRRDNEQIY